MSLQKFNRSDCDYQLFIMVGFLPLNLRWYCCSLSTFLVVLDAVTGSWRLCADHWGGCFEGLSLSIRRHSYIRGWEGRLVALQAMTPPMLWLTSWVVSSFLVADIGHETLKDKQTPLSWYKGKCVDFTQERYFAPVTGSCWSTAESRQAKYSCSIWAPMCQSISRKIHNTSISL